MPAPTEPVIVKKYANRRLYNTQTSCYITLEDIRELVKRGEDFVVQDAKSGEDLTRQILTQVIFEQEMNGTNTLLPIGFLKRVIGLYDDSVSELIPHYLESSMEAFVSNQEKMRDYMSKYMNQSWSQYNPITQLEEIRRQNMEVFNRTMHMFNPFMTGKDKE